MLPSRIDVVGWRATRLFRQAGMLFCLAMVATFVGCAGGNAQVAEPPIPSGAPLSEKGAATGGPSWKAKFETTKGDFVVEVHPDWAPIGAARFEELVTSGYYDGNKFFRVVPGFMVQWGMHGDPATNAKWQDNGIDDEPVKQSNRRGLITFAKRGIPNSRTTQLFVNYGNNGNLDGMGFAPFGEVIEGMDVVDAINAEYGESPDQMAIRAEGNAYLEREFPRLDGIIRATKMTDEAPAAAELTSGADADAGATP